MIRYPAALTAALLLPALASAEVVSSSASHYVLRHEANTSLDADALWARLIEPASWWHPDHTYSGDAGNLSLDAEAGGLWREDWHGGSVAHGQVLLVVVGKTLRLEAPFGPLQGTGAYVVWTISIFEDEQGTRVRFDETASAPETAGLDRIASAVDGVKSQAIARLVAAPDD